MPLTPKALATLRSATANGHCAGTAPARTAGLLAKLGYVRLTRAHTGERGQCWFVVTKAGRDAIDMAKATR
jgi:hypothetical protein